LAGFFMADDPLRFDSAYTDSKVNAANRVVELVCEFRAAYLEVKLPYRFWNEPQWADYYIYQLRMAHKLLKSFDALTLMQAVRETKASSLRMASVKAVAKRIHKEKNSKVAAKPVEKVTDSVGRFNKKRNLPDDL